MMKFLIWVEPPIIKNAALIHKVRGFKIFNYNSNCMTFPPKHSIKICDTKILILQADGAPV